MDISAYKMSVYSAHWKSATRGNISGEILHASFANNGLNFVQALSSAIGTLGGVHGCVEAAQDLLELEDPIEEVYELLSTGAMVPGWGSSYQNGAQEPGWEDVHEKLLDVDQPKGILLKDITKVLHESGKIIYPNPAAYTAVLSILMELDSSLATSLFIEARLPAWTASLNANIQSA